MINPLILEPQKWMDHADWVIHPLSDYYFLARVNTVTQTPKHELLYSDSNVEFFIYRTEAKSTLGYTIWVKNQKMKAMVRPWHLSIIDPAIGKHNSTSIVYYDSDVYLRKFTGDSDLHSYWFLLKNRTT